MSLETLLEAAEFIDCEREDQNGRTRVNYAENFHPYAKADSQAPVASPKPRVMNSGKNRRRSRSSTSTEEEPLPHPLPTKYSAIATGNRDLHNRLEKNRRAQLKNCFEHLKAVIPAFDEERKASNLSILRNATRHIQWLRRQETELEMEMQKLARQKIMAQERITVLKQEVNALNIDVDLSCFMQNEEDTHSASTATADNDDPIMSDDDGQSSSTLSTTSTTPGVPVFKVPTTITSPIKGVYPVGGAQKLSRGISQQNAPMPTTSTIPMHSILNRTLLSAATSVLSSLTSQAPATTVRPMGAIVRNIATINKPQTSHKVQSSSTQSLSKSSINQLLQQTLQQRQQQIAPVQLKKEGINGSVTPTMIVSQSLVSSAGGGERAPQSLISTTGGGTVIASGPASVAKLVSENQANCDIYSGIQLSSLSTAHLNTPALGKPQYVKPANVSNWSNPPSVTDGPVQISQPTASDGVVLRVEPSTTEEPAHPTIPFNRLLPSLFQNTAERTVSQPTSATTISLPAAAVSSLAGNKLLTLQPATQGLVIGGSTTSTPSSRPITSINNQPLLAAAPMQAQMITPAQLQHLLLQTNLQQQLFQPQQQKVTLPAAALATNSVPAIQLNTAGVNTTQLATNLSGAQILTAPPQAQSNVNQINLNTVPMAQILSPLPAVSQNLQLGNLGFQVNQMVPQFIKTFGLQPSTFTLPIKPLVVVSLPNMVVGTQPNTVSTTVSNLISNCQLTPKTEK